MTPLRLLFMKISNQKIPYFLLGICALLFVGGIGIYFGKATSGSRPQDVKPIVLDEETGGQKIKAYSNEKLNFSLKYPEDLSVIEEDADSVTFKNPATELWGFGVITEKVPYRSTREWIASQTKGSAKNAGYESVLWLDEDRSNIENGVLLVSEYVEVDANQGRPIFGKIFYGTYVKDGVLYKIKYRNEFTASQAPSVDSEMIGILSSFQLLR